MSLVIEAPGASIRGFSLPSADGSTTWIGNRIESYRVEGSALSGMLVAK
jgi:hypothetical protein